MPSTVETGFAVEDWPCDVVICPGGGPSATPRTDALAPLAYARRAGLSVVAAGAPDSRLTMASASPASAAADATLAAMRRPAAVVATDGLAHLAVACGRPLVMISCGPGLTAPGYRPIRMDRYHKENHAGSPIHVVTDAWDAPERVVQAVREVLAAQEAIPC